jgi:hypothetical protein
VYREQARLEGIYERLKIAYEEADDGCGRKPKRATIYVSDATVESLARELLNNPRGVTLIRDELTALVAGMDQYRAKGRGADRQFYLSAWAGEPICVHRKNLEDGAIFVPHPFLGIIGGLPPDLLTRLRGEKNIADGWLDRYLFSFPEPTRAQGETWKCVSQDSQDAWSETLRYLWELGQEPDLAGGQRPRLVDLDATGREAWVTFTTNLAKQMNEETFAEHLRGPWAKMKGYCARLALILAFLHAAQSQTELKTVNDKHISDAAKLVRYFESHARKVYAVMDADRDVEKARRLQDWIKREKRQEFKRWEPYEDLKNRTDLSSIDDLDAPLERLTKHHIIRPKQLPQRTGPGRRPAAVYEVNPHLYRHPVNPGNPANGVCGANLQDSWDFQDGFRNKLPIREAQ